MAAAMPDIMPEGSEGAGYLAALARGLTVLTAFGPNKLDLTLSDAAQLLQLPKGTARRTLYTLTCLGYLEAKGSHYTLAPKVLNLARAYLTADPIAALYQPACERILGEVDTLCTVAVLDGEDIMMVARAVPTDWLSTNYGSEYRVPAFCSALGRVLLAGLPDPALNDFIDRLTPVAQTSHTVTFKPAIHEAILSVRRDGYCFIDQEAEQGFRSVAVPIKRYNGTTVAAINIGARIEAVPKETMLKAYRELLTGEAARMRSQLT